MKIGVSIYVVQVPVCRSVTVKSGIIGCNEYRCKGTPLSEKYFLVLKIKEILISQQYGWF